MKLELLIIVITGFLVVNTYYDGKYIKLIQSWQNILKCLVLHLLDLVFIYF